MTENSFLVMLYRPDFRLLELRMKDDTAEIVHPLCGCNVSDFVSMQSRFEQEVFKPLLRWLRTTLIDCSAVPWNQRSVFTEKMLTIQQRSVLPCAARCIALKEVPDSTSTRLEQYVSSLPLLTVLDLRGSIGCGKDSFLCQVALVHHGLQRLRLPWYATVSQTTLDYFTQCGRTSTDFVKASRTLISVVPRYAICQRKTASACRRGTSEGNAP